jgi:hypothetical protein
MAKNTIIFFLIISFCGCTISHSTFIRSSEKIYPEKSEGSDILLFFKGDPPQKEYRVLGIVYAEKHALNSLYIVKPKHIIEMLRNKARKAGADAIMDVRIAFAPTGTIESKDRKLGEAKAIVFVKPKS